ncbi:hypothetical protein ACFYN3_34585 [Streptomyces lavendulae]|uniref:hypothetical protein n=1 Tax=Streptomyces lavendulae TaxID=1914 RepID=UPI00367BF379
MLNRIGRRYQLAGEVIRQVDWLGRCSTERIAWIVRHVADAGWTVADVRAWLHLRGEARTVHRPSGLLATLLDGAERILDTPAKRASAVEDWRDSKAAARRRHQQWTAVRCGPRDIAVRRMVGEALTRPRTVLSGPEAEAGSPLMTGPSEADRRCLRDAARGEFMRGETTLIDSAVAVWGRSAAEEFYGTSLVRRALALRGATSLLEIGGPHSRRRT